jgi:NIMA (never in mitosis gene a)-related kinase
VYRVERLVDRQTYALKKVKLCGLSEKELEKALNEVRILVSISNPHIIAYKEAFVEGKCFWFPCDYLVWSWSSRTVGTSTSTYSNT